MFSVLRRRLTYTNVGVTLALFFSMSGGALAASHYLITSTKQIKPSVLSALKGKAGPAGPAGSAGAAGTSGAQGPQGSAGAKGEAGTEGKQGKEGEKGKEGKAGKEGSPWTDGGTLPPEKTEAGTWAFGEPAAIEGGLIARIPLSFNIPLKEDIEPAHSHYVTRTEQEHEEGEEPPAECQGSFEEPKADPGSLCVYEKTIEVGGSEGNENATSHILNPGERVGGGAATTGAELLFVTEGTVEGGIAGGEGTWAVTAAPEEEK
jgi:hypothetical protein